MPTRDMTAPKFLKNNAPAQKEWNAYTAISNDRKVSYASMPRVVRDAPKDIGPDLYCFDTHLTNWKRTDAEWTAPSITGAVTTYDDNGFQFHIAGMRVHAYAYNYTQIYIDDGSIPLQFFNSWNETGYAGYNLATVSQKFMASWLYSPQSYNDGYGNDSWVPSFNKLEVVVLEQDATSNLASKVRLDFYRNFGETLLAVQVMIENKSMGSYLETNVRFNVTDAEVQYITNGGNRIDGDGSETKISFWAPRNIDGLTVQQYDSLQTHSWYDTDTYDWLVFWNDYNDSHHFFEGVTQTRRVPYSALDASLFFPRSTATITTTSASDVKNRDAWIITLGILVGLLAILSAYTFLRK
jgi:hypothetical protein